MRFSRRTRAVGFSHKRALYCTPAPMLPTSHACNYTRRPRRPKAAAQRLNGGLAARRITSATLADLVHFLELGDWSDLSNSGKWKDAVRGLTGRGRLVV